MSIRVIIKLFNGIYIKNKFDNFFRFFMDIYDVDYKLHVHIY